MREIFSNIFSVKNKDQHKVLTILGVKMRFKKAENYLKSHMGYDIVGENNKIIVVENGVEKELKSKIDGLNIIITGNNTIIFHKKTTDAFAHSSIRIIANSASLKFEETDRLFNLHISICRGSNQNLYWGKNTNTWGTVINLHEENDSMTIGKNCMFSGQISIWATDGHAILDKDTGEILNHIKNPLVIGDNCWIGEGVRLTKNAQLPSYSMVGGGAVVTKKFTEEYTAIAGNPARIVKQNVTWTRETAFELQQQREKSSNV